MADPVAAQQVKELRQRTGVGFMDCKRALSECRGDMEKAVLLLRERGIADAVKRTGRETKEGRIGAYIHDDGRFGVLVEINCETDFVARTEKFCTFARDVAMHIAALHPKYVSSSSIPSAIVEQERALLHKQAASEGKPAAVLEKIVEGRLQKYFQKTCLLNQAFIKDPKGKQTVEDLLKEHISLLKENIFIRRFSYFAVGEEEENS